MAAVERLGEYRLLERIGVGGTAVVHLAVDSHGREVAVKELRAELVDEPGARRALAREILAQGKVGSRHVARLLDGDVGGDRPYTVTQYVPGSTLREFVKTYGPLGGMSLTRFAREAAEGVAAIHAAGVVHRDLTPGNVMILGGSPIIIDFGVAYEARTGQETRPGILIGTPGFLAPELIEGEAVTGAADVFSWAATVAFAATGRPPFGKGSLHGVCFRILRGAVDLDGVAEPLASLLRLALRRDAHARPSAAWFAGELAQWRQAPALARTGRDAA
ncbi:serine/threonine-protein kinase [Actinomadura alba]|uniref:Serine/threonine protein kinase n=1 Tax=Actinomadura alba TaxID=406431 RepID=A0ABR7LI28_9ACTN|nr:serine/threonine-protein kinase [Actinomadura alba]MBC6464426.1 serine/threonine protein kinase [Actinomadura alba]